MARRSLLAGALAARVALGAPAAESSLPTVDLARFQPPVRARLEELEARFELQRVAAPEATAALAETAVELGKLYLAYDLPVAAAQSFAAAAAIHPQEPAAWYYLGLARLADARLDEAIAAFERARELEPDDLATLMRLGTAQLEASDLEAARLTFDDARTLRPEAAGPLSGLARCAALEDRAPEAVALFERALAIQPKASSLHYQLAHLKRRLGDPEGARRHLEQSGDQPVAFPDPLGRAVGRLRVSTAFAVVEELARGQELSEKDIVGYAIVQFGDIDGALAEFERTLASAPGDESEALSAPQRARVHWVLGALHARRDDDQKALIHFADAATLDPGWEVPQLSRAAALARIGRREDALRMLDDLLMRWPESAAALLHRAALHAEARAAPAARADLERLLALEPRHAEARLRLAEARAASGDLRGAVAEYEAALELALDDADRALAHQRAADARRRLGDPAAAIEHYRAALVADPTLDGARLGLAAALGAAGRLGEALVEARQVVAAEPRSAPARLTEAVTLLHLGRHQELRRSLEDAVAALPADLQLKAMLARHLAACPDSTVRDGERAVALAEELVQVEPTPTNRETLAMAYAEAGAFAKAVAVQEELLQTARAEGPGADVSHLETHLHLYRAHRPCCAPAPAPPP